MSEYPTYNITYFDDTPPFPENRNWYWGYTIESSNSDSETFWLENPRLEWGEDEDGSYSCGEWDGVLLSDGTDATATLKERFDDWDGELRDQCKEDFKPQ